MEVVEASEHHVPALGVFFHEAWRMTGPDAPGWAGADADTIDELSNADVLRERIGGPERRMFVALDGDRVVAFAATRWNGRGAAELSGIVVLQEMVGRGIGTPLLDAALSQLRADGATGVFVRTEADNERALGFYRARGFGGERSVVEDVGGERIGLTELSTSLDR